MSRTRQRLREIGEPEEKLKHIFIQPCLNVVKTEEPDWRFMTWITEGGQNGVSVRLREAQSGKMAETCV